MFQEEGVSAALSVDSWNRSTRSTYWIFVMICHLDDVATIRAAQAEIDALEARVGVETFADGPNTKPRALTWSWCVLDVTW